MARTPADRWFVYVLRCGDGTLYTGVAKEDPLRRLEAHRAGRGAKYTRGRLPIELVACSGACSRREAQQLEHRTKRLPRTEKIAAVSEARGKRRRRSPTP